MNYIDNETGEVINIRHLRTPYNYDTDAVSIETALDCGSYTKTQRQFKDETDINTIVQKFGVTGERPPAMTFPQEQDFTEAFDFQTSMNVIVQARESFMTLPSRVRARFQNDPQQFMEFVHNPENGDEAVRLGIATIRKPAEPPEKKEEKTDTK